MRHVYSSTEMRRDLRPEVPMSSLALTDAHQRQGLWWASFGQRSLLPPYMLSLVTTLPSLHPSTSLRSLGLLGAVMLPLPESLLTRLTGLVPPFISSAGHG